MDAIVQAGLPQAGDGQAGSGQILGLRDEQQDAFGFGTVVLADGRRASLAVLADGMGGHHGGAIAARLAIQTFLDVCRASPARTFNGALESALIAANRALATRSRDDSRLAQMGCTLIATAIDGGVLHYVSVGDSLLWRVGTERIERLNADHSMMPVVTAALAQGKMTQAEAQAHGSILRSAVTGSPIELVDLRTVELARDEWVLLASDGILSLSETVVHGFVRPTGATAQQRVDALLDAVEQVGEPEQDNCTVVLLPMSATAANAGRQPRVMVLGALAIFAGLGVVAAAGWELFRQNRAATDVAAVRPKVAPPAPISEATAANSPARLPFERTPTGSTKMAKPAAPKAANARDGKKDGATAVSSPSPEPDAPAPAEKPTDKAASSPAPGSAGREPVAVTTGEAATAPGRGKNQDKRD